MIDPARPEVKDAIALATRAGIRTIMITGDHVTTAKAIAKELNILRPGDEAIPSSVLQKMTDEEFNDWIDRRDKAESLVYKAREYIFPELQGRGHSYGIGRDPESNIAWNIHQVLRYHAGNDERKPYAVYGELPEIEVVE